jgi:hypothetical protein
VGAALPASRHSYHRSPQSCPPHIRHTLLHEIDGSRAPYFSVCVEPFYLSLQTPASLPSPRPQPAVDVEAARSRNPSSSILRGPPLSATTTRDVIGTTVGDSL